MPSNLPIPGVTEPNWGQQLNDAIISRFTEAMQAVTDEQQSRTTADNGLTGQINTISTQLEDLEEEFQNSLGISGVAQSLPLWLYGNSYGAYTINSVLTYWDRLIQKIQSPIHGNWAIPSTLAADQCAYMYGTFTASVQFSSKLASSRTTGAGTWTQNANASLGSNGLVILECVRNDAGLDAVAVNGGTTAKSRAGFQNALDAMIRCIRHKSRVENTDAAWTKTGAWTNSSGFGGCSGSNISFTSTPNDTATITISGDCDLILLGLDNSALSATGSAFEVRIDGVLFGSAGTTSNQTRKTGFTSGLTTGGNYGFCQYAVPIRGLSVGSHTLELKHTGSSGHLLYLDCLLYPRDNTAYPPPTIIVPKNPEFGAAGYAAYVALGGSNASRSTDLIYNGIIDTVIAQFPVGEVLTWDPMDHGFDNSLHIGNKDGSSVHLNDLGTEFYADGLFNFINSLPARDGLIRL